ncbi:MAG: MAPEG family protein [Hyphomonadaceae bacterium]|nr:MAPEG family protein [Hyphomonadaceae bacterium]
MLRLEVAALYVGVNILILLVLSYLVVAGRRKHKIVLGAGENRDFERAIRAHANAAEYIPAGLVGIVLVALMEPGAPLWLLHASGISLTLGRILHGIGLHTGVLNAGRLFGMVLTWAAYLLLGFGLIYAGLSQQL